MPGCSQGIGDRVGSAMGVLAARWPFTPSVSLNGFNGWKSKQRAPKGQDRNLPTIIFAGANSLLNFQGVCFLFFLLSFPKWVFCFFGGGGTWHSPKMTSTNSTPKDQQEISSQNDLRHKNLHWVYPSPTYSQAIVFYVSACILLYDVFPLGMTMQPAIAGLLIWLGANTARIVKPPNSLSVVNSHLASRSTAWKSLDLLCCCFLSWVTFFFYHCPKI